MQAWASCPGEDIPANIVICMHHIVSVQLHHSDRARLLTCTSQQLSELSATALPLFNLTIILYILSWRNSEGS
jgi:hypothetical protein